MLNVSRCRHCPNPRLTPVRRRPVDWLLLCLAVRRQRCEFCGNLQWTWLVPRPLRWGLAAFLLGVVYVGSTGPIKWLYDNYRMSGTTYEWIDRWVYWPLHRSIDLSDRLDPRARTAFVAYREWWAPTERSLRADDALPLYHEAVEGAAEEPDIHRLEDLERFAEGITHESRRPTGEPPQQ